MDNETNIKNLFNVNSFVPTIPITEPVNFLSTMPLTDLMVYIRTERNILLEATDWTQLLDAPLTEEQKGEYRVYRQALRDITRGINSYQDLVWPVKPE
jgi:hypothetical protein